jgi:hypothetical protein
LTFVPLFFLRLVSSETAEFRETKYRAIVYLKSVSHRLDVPSIPRIQCLHQRNRRSWVRISPGCKVMRILCVHCNVVLCNLIPNVIVCI